MGACLGITLKRLVLSRSTFSMARFRMFPPSWPLQVGQQVSFGLQLEQTRWPAWHWGGRGGKENAASKERFESIEQKGTIYDTWEK